MRMFLRIFIDNIISRYIRRDNPMFLKRSELCYTNWVYEQTRGDGE